MTNDQKPIANSQWTAKGALLLAIDYRLLAMPNEPRASSAVDVSILLISILVQ
jgi:hypothetical protein